MSEHHRAIDLNEFKKTHAQPPLTRNENWNADFNELDRRDIVELRSLEMKRGIAELLCSRYVVEEVQRHHAVFVDLVMVYDLKNDTPLRLLIRRGGYFLE